MKKNARTWAAVLGLVAMARGATPASAVAITYSTSGAIATSNEPDRTLHGLTGASTADVVPVASTVAPYPASVDALSLGSIAIKPIDPFSGSAAAPALAGAPFDIRVAFSDGAPTIEIKGVIRSDGDFGIPYLGQVTSITSLAPTLNAALPPQFAGALAHPGDLTVRVGMWDWGISSLPVYAAFQPVPEPSTWAVLAAGMAALAIHRRRSASREDSA